MIGKTFLKQVLWVFLIVLLSVLGINNNAQADIVVGPKPLNYIEYARFYPDGSGGVYGQGDDLPEKLSFEQPYTYKHPIYGDGHTVTQEGYVLTALAPFPHLWIFTKSVPLIEIQLTATISAFGGGFGEVRGLPLARGLIYFYGEVINTGAPLETRSVPVEMKAEANVDMTLSGSGMGQARTTFEIRVLNPDYTYKEFIMSSRTIFCDSINSDTWTCTPGYHQDPGSEVKIVKWYQKVAPGATMPFEVIMFADCAPHLVASANPASQLPSSSSMTCHVNFDPFVYIDPEWEYANEYTLKLSPGMYVGPPPTGPPPARSEFPWPMFFPAIISGQGNK